MECEAKVMGLQKDKDDAQKNAATFMQKAGELQGELRVRRALFKMDKGIDLAPHHELVSRSPSVLTQRDPRATVLLLFPSVLSILMSTAARCPRRASFMPEAISRMLESLQGTTEGTAMKSGLGTSPKSFFIISPCYQVQHGG